MINRPSICTKRIIRTPCTYASPYGVPIPRDVCKGRPVSLAWFSPDCKHFSKAKGGKPVEKHIRDLAWVVVHWAKLVRPRIIMLENVEEFKDWGPLISVADGNLIPCPLRKGFTFRRWVKELQKLGYKVEYRDLKACDYGAPTIRKRLFLIARCDGNPIVWPSRTHGQGLIPYRTAAECIDWSIPCPSIFERKRPLAENTLRRTAKGIQRYVIDANEPFIVNLTHAGSDRVEPVTEPLRTVTGAHRGEKAIVMPYLAGVGGRAGQSPERPVDRPYHTSTSKADTVLVSPTLVQTGYSERAGQAPRALDIEKPLGTVVAGGAKHALVFAFLAQHNTQRTGHNPGRKASEPLSTITGRGTQQAIVASSLIKLRGTCRHGQPVDEPIATISAQGTHIGEVRAFLLKHYGTDQDPNLREPMHTLTTKNRFGLVTVHGEEYQIVDIGMRMLTPRELYLAQGFPGSYIIGDDPSQGLSLPKTAQVRMCGNSVSPPPAESIVRANLYSGIDLAEAAD
jgi:DNA (cytosine-5)-methyltransferase 1